MEPTPVLQGPRARLLALAAGLAAAAVASLAVGPAGLRNPLEPGYAHTLVGRLRVYRTLAAASVGALLGAAGAAIQYSTSNPLASPSILGLPQGGLALVAAAVLAYGGRLPWGMGLALGALGALAAYAASVALASRAGAGSAALLVSGVAVATALSGVASLLLLLVQSRYGVMGLDLLLGTFAYATRGRALEGAAAAAASLLLLLPLSRSLDVLSYGDEVAASAGFDPWRSRLLATGLAAAAVAASIHVAGVVGFIGLIAPNTARSLVGARPSHAMLGSALTGALVALASDTAARAAAPALHLGELPAGVATSTLGGLFLAYLLARRPAGLEQP